MKEIYVWKPDLKNKPTDKTITHVVEILRSNPKKGVKREKNWLRYVLAKDKK